MGTFRPSFNDFVVFVKAELTYRFFKVERVM